MNAQADRRDCRGIQETLSVTAGTVPPLPEGEAQGIIVGAGFHLRPFVREGAETLPYDM